MKNELISHKYLLSVDVDPEADPIEKDSEEKRLKDSIKELRNDMHTQVEGIKTATKINIDALYDRLARQQERDMQRSIEITKQELENQEWISKFVQPTLWPLFRYSMKSRQFSNTHKYK